MTHKAMEDDAEGSNLETLIANVCRMASDNNDDTVLHGLLISCLSILTGSILCTEEDVKEGSLKKTSTRGDYLDPVMPALQVGSVLSLLKCKDDSNSSFHLDDEILDYLGKAATVYEERLEIQKSRMKKETPTQDEDRPLSPIPIVPLTQTDNAGNGEEEDEEEGTESPAEYDEEAGASDSESTDDSNERYNPEAREGLVPHGMGNDEDDVEIHQDDSSSSSSDSEGDPQHVELADEDNEDEVDEDNGSEDDEDDEDFDDEESDIEEDDMLREALALSLVDQGPAIEAAHQVEPPRNINEEQQEIAQEEDEEESMRRVENLFVTRPSESSKLDAVSPSLEDESTLPQLPSAPAHYPYLALLGSLNDVDIDRNEAEGATFDSSRNECLNPVEMSKFGSIPASHALVHLLRYTVCVIQQRRGENKSEEDHIRSIPGGMGSSLFEPRLIPCVSDVKSDRNEDNENAVTLQLLISTFLIFDQNRRHAIDNLRQAILTEQRNLNGEDDSDDEDRSPLSAADDPAFALAMNYVEDDVYLEEDVPSDSAQSNMSESLENKGMRRKAAAAAHDAAARLKSLRKQTEAWRNRVKLLSLSTLMSMKCLREYLRSLVALWLQRSSLLTENALSEPASILDFEKLIPPAMISRLSDSLNSLMSIRSFHSYTSLLSGDDDNDIEQVCFPLQLYGEAVSTWGECLPLLHPSDGARLDFLTSTMEWYISVAAARTVTTYPDSLVALPSSDSEVQLHKLQIMCRRLCVSDLLDGLVARPIYYSVDDTKTKVDLFGEGDTASTEPRQFSQLIKLVGSATISCPQKACIDMQRLYLALCHRCNIQVLLWDRLFAGSEVEAGDIVASSPLAGSASDVIRVNPNPSSNLQFDPLKCSDSIAIFSNHADSPSSASGPSAHQRASKVWGAVLSSSFYSPKTGLHRWAVRLDKCERGHVFVGVATSQASTRTYVGGDKYGWGVIGTQALWHDRRKVRSCQNDFCLLYTGLALV